MTKNEDKSNAKNEDDAYINPFNRQALRDAIIEVITQGEAGFDYAVTLTFPYKVNCREDAQKCCRYFRNIYGAALGYRENHVRYAKQDAKQSPPFLAMLEGDGRR